MEQVTERLRLLAHASIRKVNPTHEHDWSNGSCPGCTNRYFDYFINKVSDTEYLETLVDQDTDERRIFKHDSYPLTSNEEKAIYQKLQSILPLGAQVDNVKSLFLYETELDIQLRRFKHTPYEVLKPFIDFVTTGYVLEDILQKMIKSDLLLHSDELLEKAFSWYLTNVPLHSIYISSFKACLKSLSKVQLAGLNTPKLLGIAFARIDYELHPRVKRIMVPQVESTREFEALIRDHSSAISELSGSTSFASWKYLQRIGLRYHRNIHDSDSLRSEFEQSYFQVLSDLLGANKAYSESIFRDSLLLSSEFVDSYLDSAVGPSSQLHSGIRSIPHHLCKSIIFLNSLLNRSVDLRQEALESLEQKLVAAEQFLDEIQDREPSSWTNDWQRESEISRLQNSIKALSSPLTHEQYLAQKIVWCDDCFQTALKSESGKLYEEAVSELAAHPAKWMKVKLSFSPQTFSELVNAINQNGHWSGGLSLFANYRARNFNATAILQRYFQQSDVSELSQFELALYFIHLVSLPLGYDRRAIKNFEYNYLESDVDHREYLELVQDDSQTLECLKALLFHSEDTNYLKFVSLFFKSDWAGLLNPKALVKLLLSLIAENNPLQNEQWALISAWLEYLLSKIDLIAEESHEIAFQVLELLLIDPKTRELGCVVSLAQRLPLEDRLISILQSNRTLLLQLASTSTVKLLEVATKSTLNDDELVRLAELLNSKLKDANELGNLKRNDSVFSDLVTTLMKLFSIKNQLLSEPYHNVLSTLLSCSLILTSEKFHADITDEIDVRLVELIETNVDIFEEYLETHFDELNNSLVILYLLQFALSSNLSEETLYKLFDSFILNQQSSAFEMSQTIVRHLQSGVMNILMKIDLIYNKMLQISLTSNLNNFDELLFSEIVRNVAEEHFRRNKALSPEVLKNYASVLVFLGHNESPWSCSCRADWDSRYSVRLHHMTFGVHQFDHLSISEQQLVDLMAQLIQTFIEISYSRIQIGTKDLLYLLKHLHEGQRITNLDSLSILLCSISDNRPDFNSSLSDFPVEVFIMCCKSSKLNQEVKSVLFELMLANVASYSEIIVKKFFEIFRNEIGSCSYKSTVKLIYSLNTVVQTEMIDLLTHFEKMNLWVMFMAESVSPTLMNAAESFITNSQDPKSYEGYVLALLDSSIKQTRELAFKILDSSKFPFDQRSILIKLAEHPSPDIWGYVMDNFGSLVSEEVANRFIENVLLTRRVGRKTKLALQAYLEQHGMNSSIENTMKRLSLNGTIPDKEFSLRMLATFGQESDNLSVKAVWEPV